MTNTNEIKMREELIALIDEWAACKFGRGSNAYCLGKGSKQHLVAAYRPKQVGKCAPIKETQYLKPYNNPTDLYRTPQEMSEKTGFTVDECIAMAQPKQVGDEMNKLNDKILTEIVNDIAEAQKNYKPTMQEIKEKNELLGNK